MTNGGVDFAFDAIGAEVTLHQIVEVARAGSPRSVARRNRG